MGLTVSLMDQMVPRLIDFASCRQRMHLRSVAMMMKTPVQSHREQIIFLAIISN